jgi:hypothetical protein
MSFARFNRTSILILNMCWPGEFVCPFSAERCGARIELYTTRWRVNGATQGQLSAQGMLQSLHMRILALSGAAR